MDEETKRRVLTYLYGERADQGEDVSILSISQREIERAAAAMGDRDGITWALMSAVELSLDADFTANPKAAVTGLVERLDYKPGEWPIILAGVLLGIALLQEAAAPHPGKLALHQVLGSSSPERKG